MDREVRRRIIVVEDDPSIGGMLRELLALEGFEVRVITDGSDASSVVRRLAPDALILDVNLPGRDGIAILRELRTFAQTADLPIVMLTARADDETTWQGWSSGANYYMPKPFEPVDLVRVLRSLIEPTSAAHVARGR